MKQAHRLLFVALVAGLCTGADVTDAQDTAPSAIQKHVNDMKAACKRAGGKPGRSRDLVTVVDLTADGRADFVIDESKFICEGAASVFSGSGGSRVLVRAGAANGLSTEVFTIVTAGARVDHEAMPVRLFVIVGGSACGQRVSDGTPRSQYLTCWRPLVWNAGTGKLDFAPLSQIQPVR